MYRFIDSRLVKVDEDYILELFLEPNCISLDKLLIKRIKENLKI